MEVRIVSHAVLDKVSKSLPGSGILVPDRPRYNKMDQRSYFSLDL